MLLNFQDASGFKRYNKADVVSADDFFAKPELQNSYTGQQIVSKTNHGSLAVRIPDSPNNAPPAICNISKDGRIAAVGGRDLELFLWNMETGELAAKIRGHDVSWTASSDSKFFVTVQEDNKLIIWEMSTFQARVTLGPVAEPITHNSISTDTKWVVVGTATGKLYAWDTASGLNSKSFIGGHKGPVTTVGCFEQEGVDVVVSCGSQDLTICCWDVVSAQKIGVFYVDELEHAKKIKFWITRDGALVVAWCLDSVPFPNLVVVDTISDAKNSVFCHEGNIREARFNHDGTRIISCGNDGYINIWDTATLECLRVLEGHEGNVMSVAINDTGTRIVSSGEDCTVRVWNAEDGQQLLCLLAQDEPVRQCMFSMNGRRILTCDMAGRVCVWSMHFDFLITLLRKFADNVSSLAVSGNQQLCVVGCNTGRLMMWDIWQRSTMWEYTHHAGRVESVAFNSQLDSVVTAGADGHVHIISVATGKQQASFLGVFNPVYAATFTPDDELVAALVTDGTLLIYKATGKTRKPKFVLRNQVARITSYVWTPNSKMVAGACSDGSVMIWNVLTGNIFTVLEGSAHATCCTFDFLGKLLAVGTVLGTTKLYHLETSEQLVELHYNAGPVQSVVFNSDTSHLTTICNRQAIVWDVATTSKDRIYDFVVDKDKHFKTTVNSYRTMVTHNSTVLFDHETEALVLDMQTVDDPLLRSYLFSNTRLIHGGNAHNKFMCWSAIGSCAPDKFHTTHDAVNFVSFANDDRLLAMGSQDGSVIIYDVTHNENLAVFQAHQNGACRCVRFGGNSKEVLSCGSDSKVILWEWRRKEIIQTYVGHTASVASCDMAYFCSRVISGDADGIVYVFDKITGEQLQMVSAHTKPILSVSISIDGHSFASCGMDGKVSIWDVESGSEVVDLKMAMESQALSCAFSPDGHKLAVTETNGNVLMWNVKAGCQWFHIYRAHKSKVTGCAWSGDCRRLVTCGNDSIMALWDAESGAPLSKYNLKAGQLTSTAMSPEAIFIAAGSATGTLSVINVAEFNRQVPEPSFLYHWLSAYDPNPVKTYNKLTALNFALANNQDVKGWSVVTHTARAGNSDVMSLILDTVPKSCETLGLISAAPFQLRTRVVQSSSAVDGTEVPQATRAGMSFTRPISAFVSNKFGSMVSRKSLDLEVSGAVQRSNKSFSQQLKKVEVELFLERPDKPEFEVLETNALALAMNSKSSQCVQALLDATTQKKISFGSYHGFMQTMPNLAVRYPIMCCFFLHHLELRVLTDLEVPVTVLRTVTQTVTRTAAFFTNVNSLWQSHLKMVAIKSDSNPQAYAHVKAVMVRLPYACALGRESLLRTLVESDVPVLAYATPTVKSVIKLKWNLYAKNKLLARTSFFLLYCLVFTTYAILFQQVAADYALDTVDFWKYGGGGVKGKTMFVMAAVVLLQTMYFILLEMQQLWNTSVVVYFGSSWNLFDMVWLTLMSVILPLQFARISVGPGQVIPTLISVELLFIWFKLLFFALAFKPTGHTALMLFATLQGIMFWILLLASTLIMFAVSLMVLYEYVVPGVPYFDTQYSSLGNALLTVWDAVSFQFNLTDSAWLPRGWSQLFLVIFSVFMYAVQIVLFPMLIALARDVFQAVKTYEEAVFLKGRAMLIVETETTMSQGQMERYNNVPAYLHVLAPVSREMTDPETDKFLRMERIFKTQLGLLGERLMALTRGQNIYHNNTKGGPTSGGGRGGGGWQGGAGDPADANVMIAITMADQMKQASEALAAALDSSSSTLPAVLRQIDRLQRTFNNQDVRLEGVVTVLRDIENLLRDQQPVVIHQETQIRNRHIGLSDAELEAEVKRLLHGG